MKLLSTSRISLVCGLTLGIMVLGLATSPTILKADSLIGGTCCSGTLMVSCTGSCSGSISACVVDSDGSGTCGHTDGVTCGGGGICANMRDSTCS